MLALLNKPWWRGPAPVAAPKRQRPRRDDAGIVPVVKRRPAAAPAAAAVAAAPPPPPPAAVPLVAAEDLGESADFTPTSILDGSRCLARTWGGGGGGQCALRPVPGGQHCRRHSVSNAHGDVNTPIPPSKLRDFQRARR